MQIAVLGHVVSLVGLQEATSTEKVITGKELLVVGILVTILNVIYGCSVLPEDFDARSSRLEERSRHVQINDESTCDSCHARLGTKLSAMYPDDSVVYYKCCRRQGESTSARRRNFKHNPIFKPGWLVIR